PGAVHPVRRADHLVIASPVPVEPVRFAAARLLQRPQVGGDHAPAQMTSGPYQRLIKIAPDAAWLARSRHLRRLLPLINSPCHYSRPGGLAVKLSGLQRITGSPLRRGSW